MSNEDAQAAGAQFDNQGRPRALAEALRGIAEGFDQQSRWSKPDPLVMSTLRRAADELDKAGEALAAERERCARVCDDEARIRTEAGEKHPEESESRGRDFAAARAALNCAKGIRNGEEA